MWKVANSARQEMRPRGTGDQAGNSRRGKSKGKYPYRTKHPNFSHQLEHVGPTKQISEVQAHRICYLAPLQAPCANNRKEWQDLHKLVAKKHKEGKIQGYWLSTIYSSILQGLTDKNINCPWVFFETVHGRSSVVSVPLGEVGRIISPCVFGQVKTNLSLTTTDSRTTLALATVHLIYTLKNGSVHLKWF